MSKPFQKALILCYKKYSLFNSFTDILKELAYDVEGFDVREEIKSFYFRIHTQMFRFPFNVRNQWGNFFLQKINKIILKKIEKEKHDLVFVYNSEYLLPETCHHIKKKAKLIFFMGDSPFFTHINPFFLACLNYGDLILAGDSCWISQLNTLGIQNTMFFIPGIDLTSYYIIENKNELKSIKDLALIYTGGSYATSWGYKKALFMNQFTTFDFHIYGNRAWKKWFSFFPELENHFIETNYIPVQLLNKMYNKSRLMPVDGNPAIINGVHLRFFEALGSGVLPLVEYRKDITEVLFKDAGLQVPLIFDYKNAKGIAEYYLKNENERTELVCALRKFVLSQYNAGNNSERILEYLKKFTVV